MKKNIAKIGILAACTTLAMASSAFALVPMNGGYLTRGVSRMCYYVDSSANSYTSYINTGINRWTNSGHSPSNFIKMTAVSSNYATDVDYYGLDESDMYNSSSIGETYYFGSTGVQGNGTQPYYFSEIALNKDVFPDCSSFEKIGTCAHEFGHAMGLDENNRNTSSIMCQSSSGRTVNTVSAEDYATVVYIYGGE